MNEPLLAVNHLVIQFPARGKNKITVVNDVSFHVNQGEFVAIVGESGSGKSMTSLAIMGLLKSGGEITNGSIQFQERDLLALNKTERRKINGKEMTMIFQEPMSSLNPMLRIKTQIAETLKIHHPNQSKKAIQEKVVDLLRQVEIPNAEAVANRFPHQLSGGMRQRVMIAIAIANEPKLLIADEPTTALDVTIQKQILSLMKDLNRKNKMGVVFITHDLSVVADIADRVLVMRQGEIVEEANVFELFDNPQHPYTIRLLKAMPTLETKTDTIDLLPDRPERLDELAGASFQKISDTHFVRKKGDGKDGG
ncbi:ABC transporter ATP-binding protein [Ralstonia pickettii]|nr:ABC transporter ATP-binding protein [Ralstonia pickettii]